MELTNKFICNLCHKEIIGCLDTFQLKYCYYKKNNQESLDVVCFECGSRLVSASVDAVELEIEKIEKEICVMLEQQKEMSYLIKCKYDKPETYGNYREEYYQKFEKHQSE
jgi:hypothetical protein